jgi:hypothetical protein
MAEAKQEFAFFRGVFPLGFFGGQELFALFRRHIAQAAEGFEDGEAALRGKVTVARKDGTQFLALGGRKRFDDLLALPHDILLLGREGIPAAEVFADLLLALGREALEALVVPEDALLLVGREFGQTLEESGWVRVPVLGEPSRLAPLGAPFHPICLALGWRPLPKSKPLGECSG